MAIRGDRPPIGLGWVITWPLTAVLAAAVFLSAEELRHPQHGGAEPPPPAAASGADWYERLPARMAAVDATLRKGPLRLAAPVEETRGAGPLRFTHRLYEVQLPEAERGKAEATVDALRALDPGLSLATLQTDESTEVRVGLDGLLVTTLRFVWREHPDTRPRVALIIAPLGDDLRVARHAIEGLDAPIVLGINPDKPFASQVAALGKMFEREVALTYVVAPPPPPEPSPSDPQTPIAVRPRRAAPLPLDTALSAVPDAVAVAWTVTGAPAPKPDKALLAAIDGRALPFVGDRGDKAAATMPAPVTLVEGGDQALDQQLDAALKTVRKQGRVVLIGAPTDATLAALQTAIPQWRAAQVDIVPLSILAAAPTPAPTAAAPAAPKLSAR